MSDAPRAHCGEYEDSLAELALGILTGRARAAALAHVDACPHCAEELEQLSRAADAVVSVAPAVEPPVGFEVRILNRMGVAESPARRRAQARWAGRVPRAVMAAAAAAVALVAGLGIGWATGSGPGQPVPVAAGHLATHPVASASLVENGASVGHVSAYAGATPWMIMTLADSWTDGRVTCQVVTSDGVVHTVGSFVAKDGYGAWADPLRVNPRSIRRAQVVTPEGVVIASATLS
jgi:hypothetical protein